MLRDEENEHDKESTNRNLPHYSLWMNSVVLSNVYSYLSFRKGLQFRLINSGLNEELGISFGTQRRDNILSMIRMIRKEKHRSLQFLHGAILKINAEMRNCIMKGANNNSNGTEISVIISDEYYSLFKSGIVSFSSWIAESATCSQGGRSELKFLTKNNNYLTFSQFYVYGKRNSYPNGNDMSVFYTLKVREENGDETILIQYDILANFDNPYRTSNPYLGSSKIEEILELLEVPLQWTSSDLIKFLMTSSSAYPITFNTKFDILEKITSIDPITLSPPSITMELVNAEQREGERTTEQIIEPILISDRKPGEKRKLLETLRKILVKIYSEKSENTYNIEKSKKSSTTQVDLKMLKNLVSKLIHFTNRERVRFEKRLDEVQEEKMFVEAKFKSPSNKSSILVGLRRSFTSLPIGYYQKATKSIVTLTMDNKSVDMLAVYSAIFGKKGVIERNELKNFAIALLTLFGQCFTVKFSRISENTRAIYKSEPMYTDLDPLLRNNINLEL